MTPPEHQPKRDLDRAVVIAYGATFIPRTDLYPLQLPDGSYTVVRRPLYPDLITAHIKGLITLGAYALDETSTAQWLCLDADDALRWYGLVALARRLDEQQVPSYLEPSRRGGHLWLFTPRLTGVDIRRFGVQLLADHHLPLKRGKQVGVELYPKQDRLVTGPGSFVRLPLGKHRLTGRYYHFVTLGGEPLAPTIRDQVRLLTQPQRVSQTFIEAVLARAPSAAPHFPTPAFDHQPKPRPAKRQIGKPRRRETREPPSQRIKAAVSVAEFVGRYVDLDDQGRGCCPFHDDQHKSFSVNADHNFFYCFTCEYGGSVIDFWMRWREQQGKDGSFTATVRDLAQRLLK